METEPQDKKVSGEDFRVENVPDIIAAHERVKEDLRTHQIELEMQNKQLQETQQELMIVKQRYFDLYDLAPVGYVTLDEKGLIMEANLTAASLLGVERNKLVKRSFLTRHITPEDQDIYYLFHKKLMGCCNAHSCELRMLRADSAVLWVSLSARVVKEDDYLECYVIINDISGRKQAEEELRLALEAEYESAKRFRLLFMNAPIPYQSLDENGDFIEVNEAMLDVLGYAQEELIGKNFGDFLHPDWSSHFKENFPRFKSIGEVLGVEFVMLKKDGSSILVAFTGKVQRDNQGNFQRTHCVFQDITVRKRTEEALLESETRCRALVDLGVDGILLGSQDGIITYADKRICDMFGMKEEDFIGKSIRTLPHTHECHRKSPFRFDTLQEGEIIRSERVVIRPDGSEVALETRTKIMPDGTYQIVCHDVTKRVQLEKALIESERLSVLGELSHGVAHDFNNSLQMIIGYLDLAIMNPKIDPDVAESLKNARRGALDAATRIRQLQRFTKKTSRVEFRAMNINNIIEEAVQQSRPIWKDAAEKKGLQVTIQKSYGKIMAVDGDDAEIRSALHNLIKNAIEAMPNGGTITLETGTFDRQVYIRIIDTGVGMDEKTKKRIFEPFFTTKGYKLGMGLGMSIVNATVRDHGGRIFVRETEVGKGTTIELLLPIRTKKEEAPEEQASDVCSISVRVLWVDDEEVIRKLGKLFLGRLGHIVDVADSGEDALRLLEKNQYDLMITDIGMPKMSGWQLLNAINGRYPRMKIVVLSGWGAAEFGDEKVRFNIEHIVGKPITQADLKKLLAQMFQAKT